MNHTLHTVRAITDHTIDPATEKLTIDALDAPDPASHVYQIRGFDCASNPGAPLIRWRGTHDQPARHLSILFQNGPIGEVGVNGITNEVLLAIVADRLRGFQSGPFVCVENEYALAHIETALTQLKECALARMQRGVEGTYKA